MILRELRLTNFGLFRGKQRFELSPAGRNGTGKPIVLFGGMNGGGKTTIFDGLQLALYGSRARCSKRAGRTYDDFLRDSINNGVSPETGAGVSVSFSIATNGVPSEYEVRRDWQVTDGRVKESLVVHRDGFPDNSITRQWTHLVEELLPLEISQLFFFDAEKIRALAEDASSSETLGAAIKTLLGLDIVERLIADTTVLQARLAKKVGSPEKRAEVEELERTQATIREDITRLQTQRASLENERLRAESELHDAEEAFSLSGGKHVEERNSRREKLAECERLIDELEVQLIALAATELPLLLVPDLLELATEQDKLERSASTTKVVREVLAERDQAILSQLDTTTELPKKYLRIVADVLAADRDTRAGSPNANERLRLTESGRSHLLHLRERRLGELRGDAARLVDRLATATKEKEDLTRLLAATPEDTDIAGVIERLKEANQAFARLAGQAAQLDEQIAAKRLELGTVERKLREHLEAQMKEGFDREDVARMTERAAKTRTTMQEFLRRATERKIDRLSGTITESFQFLLRKRTLVERILIDPTTFAVTLYDNKGTALSRHRLSEGEKQIFAISMLWGLARSSSRPLPAIIDTPMARLDATHRQHLVERYFPKASHQVIILSTDTEVDKKYYDMLRPNLARAYQLDYDEKERATVGREGYFWTD
jgi:DNA sulfur modification protein DndD